jgi:hypothetical protein
MHFLYLTMQVPISWHTSNVSFLTKERSQVKINFFDCSNSKKYLVIPDVVRYDEKKWLSQCMNAFLDVKQ